MEPLLIILAGAFVVLMVRVIEFHMFFHVLHRFIGRIILFVLLGEHWMSNENERRLELTSKS